MDIRTSVSANEESDEDFDWEEVAVPITEQPAGHGNDLQEGPSNITAGRANIEITLQARPKVDDSAKCVC